jgi:TolA-binding protein
MDCQAINREDLAEKYLRHRLDAAQMDEFETHLLECAKCARELELLQTVQTDLAERAHEIRGWTAPKPGFFRWQIIALAGIVIVVATASVALRWQKMQTASTTAPPPQTPPPLTPTTTKDSGTSAANKPAPESNRPVNGRNVDFTLKGSRSSSNIAPSIGAAPASGKEMAGTRAPSEGLSVAGKNVVDNPVNVVPEQQLVAATNSQAAVETAKAEAQLTTEQGVELFQVGAVEAPPFSFAGMAAHAKPPKGGKSTTYSGNAAGVDTGRVLFQQAMNAYIDGRYHAASGHLTGALKFEPSAADVNFYLGICRILDNHPEESIPALQIAIAAGNSPYLQSAHYYLGKAYVQEMNLEGAEAEFRAAAGLTGSLSTDAKALLARVVALRAQIEKNK